jgi:hypothetical protein
MITVTNPRSLARTRSRLRVALEEARARISHLAAMGASVRRRAVGPCIFDDDHARLDGKWPKNLLPVRLDAHTLVCGRFHNREIP